MEEKKTGNISPKSSKAKYILLTISSFILIISAYYAKTLFLPNHPKVSEKETFKEKIVEAEQYEKYMNELYSQNLIEDEALKQLLRELPENPKQNYKFLKSNYENLKSSPQMLMLYADILEYFYAHEESLQILRLVEQFYPENNILKDKIKSLEDYLEDFKNLVKEKEKELDSLAETEIIYKFEGLTLPHSSIISNRSEELNDLSQKIEQYRLEMDDRVYEVMARKWSLALFAGDESFNLTEECKQQILENGINFDVILADASKVLKSTSITKEEIETKVESIYETLVDNYNTFFMLKKSGEKNREDNNTKISHELLFQIHSSLYNNSDIYFYPNRDLAIKIAKFKYKTFPNNHAGAKGYLIFSPPKEVSPDMDFFIERYNELVNKNLAPEVLATFFLLNFIEISPFQDGNERVAKCLVSYIFLSFGMLPFYVTVEDLENFRYSMNEAIFKSTKVLRDYLVDNQLESLWYLEKLLGKTSDNIN